MLSNNKNLILNKKEVATRHTNQAIKMFFHKEDPVPTLVIVCAANYILHDLAIKNNIPILLGYNGIFQKILIKQEFQQIVNTRRSEIYNFFKHAKKDFDKMIEFNPDLIWYYILENIIIIKQLDCDFSKEMGYFVFWLTLAKRNLFVKNQYYDNYIKNFNISVKDLFELYDDFINNDKIKLEVYQKFKKWLF